MYSTYLSFPKRTLSSYYVHALLLYKQEWSMHKKRKYRMWVYAGTWAQFLIYSQLASIYLIYACDSFLSFLRSMLTCICFLQQYVQAPMICETLTYNHDFHWFSPRSQVVLSVLGSGDHCGLTCIIKPSLESLLSFSLAPVPSTAAKARDPRDCRWLHQ
jgi:hypothetical protein